MAKSGLLLVQVVLSVNHIFVEFGIVVVLDWLWSSSLLVNKWVEFPLVVLHFLGVVKVLPGADGVGIKVWVEVILDWFLNLAVNLVVPSVLGAAD